MPNEDTLEEILTYSSLDEFFTNSKSHSLISLDMWGTCTSRNVRRVIRQNRALKPLRLLLLSKVLAFCREAAVDTFVYGGTALSVYREAGKILEHDTDIDLAALEFDNMNNGTFTKLVNTCADLNVTCSGICAADSVVNDDSDIRVHFASSLTYKKWLRVESRHPFVVHEEAYNGLDCKIAKFFFTDTGLRNAVKYCEKSEQILGQLATDPSLVHVDLFTLSRHPLDSNSFRVNWNIPGVYNCIEKPFPIHSILPTYQCLFENVELSAPADLKTYLEIEYGYLGRDAMYDSEKQLYVQAPYSLY